MTKTPKLTLLEYYTRQLFIGELIKRGGPGYLGKGNFKKLSKRCFLIAEAMVEENKQYVGKT